MDDHLQALEEKIGVRFQNKDFVEEALTHRSYLNEHPEWPHSHNERLEYLGDAVLELAVTEELFGKFPDSPEGKLTVFRAALVNYQLLSAVASEIGLEQFIHMSKGERADTAKAREVILANAIEALIGAIYLDRGYGETKRFTDRFVFPRLSEIVATKRYKDAKSELQEIIQERMRVTPTYRVLEESGPAHRKIFRVGVYVDENLIAEGAGNSKQEAELEAAQNALRGEK